MEHAEHGAQGGVVAAHLSEERGLASEHERASLLGFVRRIAALRQARDAGVFDPAQQYEPPVYLVPNGTLTGGEAAALGIRSADDFFGGVVPHAFVATKAISHPLAAPGARALPGWNPALSPRLGDAVLAGVSAFDLADAESAGLRLLAAGPVRVKPVLASGGTGQRVARDATQLREALAAQPRDEVEAHGLVIEENLSEVSTLSVGQVRIAGIVASYHGEQRLTRNNRGEEVFGGSDLSVVRGGFEALLAQPLEEPVRQAIDQARRYDAAVRDCYPGFFASRCNYDVVLGRDARGRPRCAVLEQSWRVGGATGCEIAALEVLQREPGRERVRARCFELFGDSPEPPRGAAVYWRGEDPRAGRLTKYTVVDPG